MSNPIEYLKGVGPQRADLLKKELSIFTFGDLLEHFPFRHVDKSIISLISDINPQTEFIQVAGTLMSVEARGEKRGRRLVAEIQDASGVLELIWFQGIPWIRKSLQPGKQYLVYGRAGYYLGIPQITHPELEAFSGDRLEPSARLEPVYPTTEKLKARGLGGRQIGKLTSSLFQQLKPSDLLENLPDEVVAKMKLFPRYESYRQAHFPTSPTLYQEALHRLKFEELFLAQIRMGLIRSERHSYSRGPSFSKVGELFHAFYHDHLPFELTSSQKKVFREIRNDLGGGRQMNRLLQGDVGSGKTVIALLAMLLAADNGYQSCLMAPTEILAAQHAANLIRLTEGLPLLMRLLTSSTRKAERKATLDLLVTGELNILIGTHAVLEDRVQFKELGLAIVDEQHRFGVAQRARLWQKASISPHVLVMTATPIPRTLAMTAYGDLDYSVIDELPPGRIPVTTVHRLEHSRAQVMDFVKAEIAKGRQAYFIFPLIEESEKLDYENLMRGYENIKAFFPEPQFWISMVHGRQKAAVKQTNMNRFAKGDTQIMVSTTVVEVGVDVPNASVMVIENAEKFGLSQLHQLRGRVGRGGERSFCILLTSEKQTREARERIKTLCATNDGFIIADKDLELRGPGDIEGTRQSGALDFKLASLLQDKELVQTARKWAEKLLAEDPDLQAAPQAPLRQFLQSQRGKTAWSLIS